MVKNSRLVEENLPEPTTTSGDTRSYKMVLVANMSLKMGTGKIAAQASHATLGVYTQLLSTTKGTSAVARWNETGQMKIALRGQNADQLYELQSQAKEEGCSTYLVRDAGCTQVEPGSHTVLAIFGTIQQVNKLTAKLRLL